MYTELTIMVKLLCRWHLWSPRPWTQRVPNLLLAAILDASSNTFQNLEYSQVDADMDTMENIKRTCLDPPAKKQMASVSTCDMYIRLIQLELNGWVNRITHYYNGYLNNRPSWMSLFVSRGEVVTLARFVIVAARIPATNVKTASGGISHVPHVYGHVT